ncbi:hypothetical protein H0H81_008343, partial [Sphagnurus paluster]
MDYLDSDEAAQHLHVTKRLYFKAFATTAFTLWTRNDELINLKMKDVQHRVSDYGQPYLNFRLVFRKTNKDHTKGQDYQIPADVQNSEVDCYTHMSTWLTYYQALSSRPLTGEDYVFPAIASTGQLKFGEATSRSGFELLMDSIVEQSGVLAGRNG